ncbi:MAG: hypothetical protein KDB27_25220, partial [Planctomycetales bacterium]|nr:hypothetical protein [Planctomycetales bacterium]
KWLKMDEVSFRSNAGDFWASIVEKFRTVVPIKPELTDKRFEDVVILSPVTNTDWTIPVESLPMRIGLTQDSTTLAKLCSRSAIYANSTRLIDIEAGLGIDTCKVFASDQIVDGKSIAGEVSRVGLNPMSFKLNDPPFKSDAEALVIVGHASNDFHAYLRHLDFPHAKVVVLLMCSGVESQAVRGPISENVTFDLSTRLADDSVLVTSRIAIGIDQACEFAQFLLSEDNRDRSVAELVRQAVVDADDPYKAPWVVLS